MKTVLKKGQKVEIRKVCTGELEGKAVLVALVKKNHSYTPPFETWMVKFDEDDEPMERDIRVKLPHSSGMASSLARSPESKSLLTFMSDADLSDDWVDPRGHGITAYVTGKVLSNENGAVEVVGRNKANDELLVHLEHGKTGIVLNLNTLLVLASSYVRLQYDVATEAVEKAKEWGPA